MQFSIVLPIFELLLYVISIPGLVAKAIKN